MRFLQWNGFPIEMMLNLLGYGTAFAAPPPNAKRAQYIRRTCSASLDYCESAASN
jgi:hypothetical protein